MIKAGDLVFIWNPKKGDNFLIKVTPGMSQGTHFGQIKHTELMEHGYGEGIVTPKGEVYYLLSLSLLKAYVLLLDSVLYFAKLLLHLRRAL